MIRRRDVLFGSSLLLLPRSIRAACSSIDALLGIGEDFAGGLETRNGANVGYWPFRVNAPAGGTWLWSGDGNGIGRRLAWLPNGSELGMTSRLNAGSCNQRNGVTGNCASSSPALRPGAHGSQWHWVYPERWPVRGNVAAPTSDQGWVDINDLDFVGYQPHALKKGPAGRDFEVHTAACDGDMPVAANGEPNAMWGANVECNAVNACDEGDDDCSSDDGNAIAYGEDSQLVSTCLGGYEFSPYVPDANSPDMVRGSEMPLSYLFFAIRSNTKMYLHAGDTVKVMYRTSLDVAHGDGSTTRSTWYGVEVLSSGCPVLSPVGVRGWVMAFSEWDQQQSGRGLFFSSVG